MKKCQRCGFESADTMQFCLNCGAAIPDVPPMAFNLRSDAQTESLSGGVPTNFGANRETETFVHKQPPNFAPSYPALSPPKSKSKLGLILGGIASLLVLMTVAGAAIFYYNFKSSGGYVANVNPTPSASPTIDVGKSPTPRNLVSPNTTFTPPIEATKKGTFTVYANSGWQLSDIDVVPLEQFRTTAQGAIDLAGIKTNVPPKGLKDEKTKSRRIYPEHPTGALLMRTRYADGKYSNLQPMALGTGLWQNYPDERGRLEFCINDNAPESNGGQFTVTVTMTSVPKQKK